MKIAVVCVGHALAWTISDQATWMEHLEGDAIRLRPDLGGNWMTVLEEGRGDAEAHKWRPP